MLRGVFAVFWVTGHGMSTVTHSELQKIRTFPHEEDNARPHKQVDSSKVL